MIPNRLDVEISSLAQIKLVGQVRYQGLDTSSRARYNRFKMIYERTLVDISSAGLAQVHAKEELNVYASNGGLLEFQGKSTSLTKHFSIGDSVSQY